jgi:hypothetical protein
VGYGIGRFGMEQLRVDTAERYLGLSRNSWVALLVIALGIAGALWWQRRATPEPDPTTRTADEDLETDRAADEGSGTEHPVEEASDTERHNDDARDLGDARE